MIKTNLTHRELCEVGATLLRKPESANGHGCHFSIVEPSCYGENPDVFGIRHGNGYDVGTILLEAKRFLKKDAEPGVYKFEGTYQLYKRANPDCEMYGYFKGSVTEVKLT
ncbi:hypothetical protein [Acinetobacter beijerinckii]|uniref:hypothetical protein n=1 Tax=Acinetobacter beijerinckii TaxID=262668 RepID=UPI00300A69B0